MLLTPLAIIFGAALGLLRGGSLKAVLGSPVRHWPVLIVGIVAHTTAEQFDVPWRLSLLVIGTFLLVVSALLNAHLKGALLSGIGLSLNLAAIVANGHIPIRFEALVAVGKVPAGTDPDLVTTDGLWELETADTVLPRLGDIVPLPLFDEVVSFGDLILVGGLIILTMNLVLHTRRVGIDVDDLLGDDERVDVRDVIDLEPATEPQHAAEEVGLSGDRP